MNFKCINKKEAICLMNEAECIIVDIRDRESYNDGHIDGAINILYSDMQDFVDSIDINTNVIVCCYHGNSSKNISKFLSSEGFKNVYSLDGGYENWKIN